VRLCCNQRHWGVVCPDEMVMCCICYHRVPADQVYTDVGGQKWDMCDPCGKAEERVVDELAAIALKNSSSIVPRTDEKETE
jgi:hypothetical protein